MAIQENQINQMQPKPRNSSAFSPGRIWNNFKFRTKLTILLVGSVSLPVIAMTQGVVWISDNYVLPSLQGTLDKDLTILEEAVGTVVSNNQVNAAGLAKSISVSGVDLNNPSSVSANRKLLEAFAQNSADLPIGQSFRIFTDLQGRTIAQNIRILDKDFSSYDPLPGETLTLEAIQPTYKSVITSTGIPLGDIAIVKDALTTGRSLSGVELVKANALQRLGLAKQADIGLRKQATKGLSDLKKPSPDGTYDIDRGKIGLIAMAVEPVRVNGKLVGTSIVGTLLNRNSFLPDYIKLKTGVSTATIFAEDFRVTTNVPYADGKTRAIGTRVSKGVALKVLNQGKVFRGDANIVGTDYLTGYSPLYSHQKQLDPSGAKAVGILYVGEPKAKLLQPVQFLQLASYGFGSGILLLAGLLALPAASTFSRPLRRLTDFAKQRASGETTVRLSATEGQDEIGVLSRSLNQMADSNDSYLAAQIEASEQESIRKQQDAQAKAAFAFQISEQERERSESLQKALAELLNEVGGASKGDLTVRAAVSAGEIGIVADFFNSIVESLRGIVSQVKVASAQVNASVGSNEAVMGQLAHESQNQALQITDTLKSVEQMAVSIQQVAENAREAAEVSQIASMTATAGGKTMDRTVESIVELRATVTETAQQVKRLGESSKKISKAVTLINQISLQTNVLAVNASIEAARAGEEGQGFAVVAEEVAALAAQSAAATKEIEQIVRTIQSETSSAVKAMERGSTQVDKGTRQVEEAKESLQQIVRVSQQIDKLLQSISSATVSQTETSEVVKLLMAQINQSSERTSDTSRQVSSALQETVAIAERLQSSVNTFKVDADNK
jgi:methyl-accepting chemotaxis protein